MPKGEPRMSQADAILPSPSSQMDWGLSGWSKILANFGAIGVVCVLLVFSFYTLRETHREDVVVFREEMREFRLEMRAQREHDAEQRKMTNTLVSHTQESIKETLRVVAQLAKDVAILAAEVKQVKKGSL